MRKSPPHGVSGVSGNRLGGARAAPPEAHESLVSRETACGSAIGRAILTDLAVYDLKELANQPAWTHESIQQYLDAGLVAPWLERNIP